MNVQLSQVKKFHRKKISVCFSLLWIFLIYPHPQIDANKLLGGCKQMALARQPTGGVYFCVRPMLASQVWLTLSYSHGACRDGRPWSGSHIVSWHLFANMKTWPPSPRSEVTLHSCHKTHTAQGFPQLTSVTCSGTWRTFKCLHPQLQVHTKLRKLSPAPYCLDTLCHQFSSIPTSCHSRMAWEAWFSSQRTTVP